MMEHDEAGDSYNYEVDKNDILVGVGENWKKFAEENSGGSACLPQNILGSSLWFYIPDSETKNLYEMILLNVRDHNRQATFPFRCDSPEKRRFLNLTVIPMRDRYVHFESRIMRTELRMPVELLRCDIKRSEEFVRICSMCKKVAVSDTEWEEIEIAARRLKVFEKSVMPRLTHGICQACYDIAMAELDSSV